MFHGEQARHDIQSTKRAKIHISAHHTISF